MGQNFNVKSGDFEGPLELLLSLVEKRKLFINDVSLAEVADDFIDYTNRAEGIPLREVTHFLVVAATLVLIKSKSLLPTLELTEEEAESIEDLNERLRKHKIFVKVSDSVNGIFAKAVVFPRTHHTKNMKPVFAPNDEISSASMHESVLSVLHKVPKKENKVEKRVEAAIKLEEVIESVAERVQRGVSTSFKSLCGTVTNKKEKVTAVVHFLAILELVKQGTVLVAQEGTFTDISIERGD